MFNSNGSGSGFKLILGFLLLSLLLCSCDPWPNYAPVIYADNAIARHRNYHIVKTGETLYSIAWRYDMDYRKLARINRIYSPYTLNVGQKIHLQGNSHRKAKHKIERKPKKSRQKSKKNKHEWRKSKKIVVKHWHWPAKGKLIARFMLKKGNKGINIAGRLNSPVRAAAAGKVVYSGSGLRGYGKLLIIKHNEWYLSAYAHNRQLLVHEGMWVRAEQQIAKMGNTGSRRIMLHFELRRVGKPVDPLRYLPRER